jgi:hypothetical protein
VPFVLTELSRQECLDQVPGDGRSHSPAAQANDVHVIVLDPLFRGKVVVDERRA